MLRLALLMKREKADRLKASRVLTGTLPRDRGGACVSFGFVLHVALSAAPQALPHSQEARRPRRPTDNLRLPPLKVVQGH
jgi:hypothetical protein